MPQPEAELPEAEGEQEIHPEAPGPRGRVDVQPEAMAEKRKADDKDELLESINAARRLDGLRPLTKRPRITSMETPATKSDTKTASEAVIDDELLLLYEDAETVYLTNAAKRDAVVEARLTPEEKRSSTRRRPRRCCPGSRTRRGRQLTRRRRELARCALCVFC